MKTYYLTKLIHTRKGFDGKFEVIQLVYASSKFEARRIVNHEALKELSLEDIVEIRVNDTLIGD